MKIFRNPSTNHDQNTRAHPNALNKNKKNVFIIFNKISNNLNKLVIDNRKKKKQKKKSLFVVFLSFARGVFLR